MAACAFAWPSASSTPCSVAAPATATSNQQPLPSAPLSGTTRPGRTRPSWIGPDARHQTPEAQKPTTAFYLVGPRTSCQLHRRPALTSCASFRTFFFSPASTHGTLKVPFSVARFTVRALEMPRQALSRGTFIYTSYASQDWMSQRERKKQEGVSSR